MKKIFATIFISSIFFISVVYAQQIELARFKYVFTGNDRTFVITEDNRLFGFGKNVACSLGAPSNQLEIRTPRYIMSGVSYVSISSGATFILKTDGTLWYMGVNWGIFNDLIDSYYNHSDYSEPVKIANNVKHISAGEITGHSLIVKTDNTLWGWGFNNYKQLGFASFNPNYAENPFQHLMDNVIYATAAGDCSFVIKTDYSLWGMGDNWVWTNGTR